MSRFSKAPRGGVATHPPPEGALTTAANCLAYSYLRLSSDRQSRGDGERRQFELAEAYCQELGLRLDETLKDIGVSGFSGANRERGALRGFLDLVRFGRVPRGSHLIVESLDRLSRDQIMRAFKVFQEILEAGVTIHTVGDRRVYTWDGVNSNFGDLMWSLMVMSRAHEESAMKAFRQRRTWEEKRNNAGVRKVSARCPTWLELNPDRLSFTIKLDRAQLIRRIFEETADGIGCDKIARRFNAECIQPFAHGRFWHGGTVRAYLENRAVLGEYQPGKTEVYEEDGVRQTVRVRAGDPIQDYYPPIISQELWHRAWASIDTRRTTTGVSNSGGRRGTKLTNLFGDIAVCSRCRGVLNVRDRGAGRRSPAFLQCSGFRSGSGCKNNYQFPIKPFEEAILTFIQELDLREAAPVEVRLLETSLACQREKAVRMRDRIDELIEIAAEGIKAARAKIVVEESTLETLQREIAAGEDRLATLKGSITVTERQAAVAALRAQLQDPNADVYAIRSRLRQSLREIISWISFGPPGDVVVCVQGGAVGYLFHGPQLVRRLEWPLGGPMQEPAARLGTPKYRSRSG